jgi:hypothetical protein
MDDPHIQAAVRDILIGVGEDVEREGLRATPERIRRLYHKLPAGYAADPVALVNGALFQAKYDEMIVARAIEFSNLCQHHLMPFIGQAHAAYVLRKKILGCRRSRASSVYLLEACKYSSGCRAGSRISWRRWCSHRASRWSSRLCTCAPALAASRNRRCAWLAAP